VIVAVCADKGAPGVTTLCLTLGMVWPGERVVLEGDVSGSDLAFWARASTGAGLLGSTPNTLSVAAEARAGLGLSQLSTFAQHTTLGVPVIPGALRPEAFSPMGNLWPQLAAGLAGWSGTAIVDLGRLQPGNPAWAVAKQATATVLVARATVEGLHRLRDRVLDLGLSLGTGEELPRVAVVAVAERARSREALKTVRAVLAAASSPVPVVGVFAWDVKAVGLLRAGVLAKPLVRSELVSSSTAIVQQLVGLWPELSAAQAVSIAAAEPQPSGERT
jgi:hypothetical protein